MTKKCKFCLTPLIQEQRNCPVCKLDSAKDKTELTPEEAKIWQAARNLRIVGILTILRGVLGIMASAALFAPQSQPVPLAVFGVLFVFSISSIWVGMALGKFRPWAYEAGSILYALFLIFDFFAARWLAVFVAVVFLYVIANPTAKKILKREL
jgi:hypothetical protein